MIRRLIEKFSFFLYSGFLFAALGAAGAYVVLSRDLPPMQNRERDYEAPMPGSGAF